MDDSSSVIYVRREIWWWSIRPNGRWIANPRQSHQRKEKSSGRFSVKDCLATRIIFSVRNTFTLEPLRADGPGALIVAPGQGIDRIVLTELEGADGR